MRKNLRGVVIALIAFIIVGYFYPGFSYGGNVITLLLAGGIFAILAIFVKPILNILSLPFNLLTFGLFSFLINVLLLFAITFALPSFHVTAFNFTGATLSGFVIPAWHLSQLYSAVIASFVIGFLTTLLFWIFQ